MNTEIEQVMTQEVFEAIEKTKRVKGRSMKSMMNTRGQANLTATETNSIVEMIDRTFSKTSTGWKSSKKAQ